MSAAEKLGSLWVPCGSPTHTLHDWIQHYYITSGAEKLGCYWEPSGSATHGAW